MGGGRSGRGIGIGAGGSDRRWPGGIRRRYGRRSRWWMRGRTLGVHGRSLPSARAKIAAADLLHHLTP
jgi:hypothetical protein